MHTLFMDTVELRIRAFRRRVRAHYRRHGRDLPWRKTRNPYRILVSEVMLQQTQTERVKKFYPAFLRRFPTIRKLAASSLGEILRSWQGMGYNRRAMFLQKIARRIEDEYGGRIPSDPETLVSFPGIGKNTAGAIAAFAFDRPVAFIETNIRRAFIHDFFPRKKIVRDRDILKIAQKALDRKNPCAWHYALMDYGVYLARIAGENPNRRSAHYARQPRFEGSNRQVRTRIVRLFLAKKELTLAEIARNLGERPERIASIAASLRKDGFIKKSKNLFSLSS